MRIARTGGITAFLVAAVIFAVGLSVMANEWQPGMFWQWKATSVQSPSLTNIITVYVLTSTKVLNADVYVLGQVFSLSGQPVVTLGEVMRSPYYPTKAFGIWFQQGDNGWFMAPVGWESQRSWKELEGPGVITGTTTQKVAAAGIDVTVPAGDYPHCIKLVESYQVTYPDKTYSDNEIIWYSPDIGWPVKIAATTVINGKTHQGTTLLIKTGKISPAEAAQKLLAAIDEMEHTSPLSNAPALRRKLLSLGLLNPTSP